MMRRSLAAAGRTGTRLLLLVVVGGLAACGTADSGEAVDGSEFTAENLEDQACDDGALTVYESTPGETMQQVLDEFGAAYPCLSDLVHVRVPGQEVGHRIQQESLAGAETGDVAVSGPDTPAALNNDELLASSDWEELGLPDELAEASYAVPTVTSPYVIVYNTDRVSADEAPADWDDLTDPAWEGRLVAWSRPTAFAQLTKAWSDDQVVEYMESLLANGIALQDDSANVVQTVVSGEFEVGFTQYNHALRAQQSGAPIEFSVPADLPADTLYAYIPSDAENQAAARLFVSWLNGPEGSVAYEQATLRGNGLIEGTETNALLDQGELATHQIDEVDSLEVKIEEFGGIWSPADQGGS